MKDGSLKAKINSIEAQLEILKFSDKEDVFSKKAGGLRNLKGVLKGKAIFSEADFEEAKIKFRERL